MVRCIKCNERVASERISIMAHIGDILYCSLCIQLIFLEAAKEAAERIPILELNIQRIRLLSLLKDHENSTRDI